ncbi:unnamed protein product [Adineta steineri]|uniref:Uncharacterized protein n=1 Tax=Adineta steineri TaxID=433720 RepID=A0A818M4Q0_9BILA|nr:unnamed protein product [Adineta steineri]CAF3584344.1 unnamed protein product [Adineta steineri]
MGEILILKSINGRQLTDALVNSWFDANEMFVTKTIFSHDRYSVEVTFIDEDRADMMSDLLSTCYGDSISVERPQTLMTPLNTSFDDERVPSPAPSVCSVSSKVSCFSQRLISSDKKRNDDNDKIKLAVGRGRGIDTNLSQMDKFTTKNTNNGVDDDTHSVASSGFGRGRGSTLK